MYKKFDLNIEKILENWTISHAIREIIANALDEQVIAEGKNIEIYPVDNSKKIWCIRDYGRGLNISHLVQKENDEKLSHPNLIGQFGIGLKDSLATFKRKNVDIKVKSKNLILDGLEISKKEGFADIYTLHAVIRETDDKSFIGTEFILKGVTEQEIIDAKNLFLNFQNLEILESNKYGKIIKKDEKACIFLNGVKVNEEPDFLFSYNITSLSKKIKNALNRERTNVGRSAYSDSIKSILKSSTNEKVLQLLGNEMQNIEKGTACEEIGWIDIQEHVIKHLNLSNKFMFITSREAMNNPEIIDEANFHSDKEMVFIPDNLKNKLVNVVDIEGEKIYTFETYAQERIENFEYKFINANEMTKEELLVFNKTNEIIKLIGNIPKEIREKKISETMQKNIETFLPATGVWESQTGRIIIKRSTLKDLKEYASTLMHEVAHAKSNSDDVTRQFELELTNMIGILVSKILLKEKG